MRLLFIVYSQFDNSNGISKKIQAQVNALRNNRLEVSLCHYLKTGDDLFWAVDNKPIAKIGKGIAAHLRFYTFFRPIYDYIIAKDFDVIYLRYVHNGSWFMNRFFRKLNKADKSVYIEIPTYPYDGEYPSSSIVKRLQLWIERNSREKFHNSVKRIVTFSEDKEIFGIPTINLSNSVAFEQIPLRKLSSGKDIRFIGVANINFWHGFDRFIKGLSDYYKQSDHKWQVYFDVVGNGALVENLRNLAHELAIEEYVIFHGPLSGEKLDEVFNTASAGVGCLGCHRKNIKEVKSLKNVEYAARGIPFIYSENNSDFDNQPYVIKVLADESPINIQDIINQLNEFSLSPAQIRASVNHLSWNTQMKQVANKLLN